MFKGDIKTALWQTSRVVAIMAGSAGLFCTTFSSKFLGGLLLVLASTISLLPGIIDWQRRKLKGVVLHNKKVLVIALTIHLLTIAAGCAGLRCLFFDSESFGGLLLVLTSALGLIFILTKGNNKVTLLTDACQQALRLATTSREELRHQAETLEDAMPILTRIPSLCATADSTGKTEIVVIENMDTTNDLRRAGQIVCFYQAAGFQTRIEYWQDLRCIRTIKIDNWMSLAQLPAAVNSGRRLIIAWS